jgi:hypothetical protein
MLSLQHMQSGTDINGVRIKVFTAAQNYKRARENGFGNEYTYEGGTIPSDEEGLRLPGKLRHGHGESKDEIGNSFVGQWANDKRHGKGTYKFACGDVYEGEWMDGMYHGKGKYTSATSDEYEGEWKGDKMHGHGTYFYRDSGDTYEGGWFGGFREGIGRYTCADGTVFVGHYEVGELIKKIKIDQSHLLSGTDESGNRLKLFSATETCQRARAAGVYKFVYDGDTLESDLAGLKLPGKLRHGDGEIRYEYGASYVGQWVNDKRTGTGKFTFACNDVYEGEWLDNKYHGQGKYTSAESDEYEGQWHEDKMHGTGKYFYRDTGDTYEGSFVHGVREGPGKYIKADGTVTEGEWKANELVQAA